MRQTMKKLRSPLLAATLAAVLSGCTVGPDYLRPIFETPANWRVDYQQAASLTNLRWWEQFQDPVLNQLVETALRQNQISASPLSAVRQFLNPAQTTRSQFFPQVGYGLDINRNRAWKSAAPLLCPRAPIRGTGCIKARSAPTGRSTSSVACGGRARRRRHASSPASRDAAAPF